LLGIVLGKGKEIAIEALEKFSNRKVDDENE